jgi:hypothetical protein
VINERQQRRMQRLAVVGATVPLAPLLAPARPAAAAEPLLSLNNPTFRNAAAFDRTAPVA